MSRVESIGAFYEKPEISADQENKNNGLEATTSSGKIAQQADDIIAIGTQALQRLQEQYPDEEAVNSETALQLLEHVKNTSAQELEQAHQPFDPERVFQLVGLLD